MKQDIKILLATKNFFGNYVISSLPEIANKFVLFDKIVDDNENILIKAEDPKYRNKIINKLRNEDIIGWLTSLENTDYIEVCLFTKILIYILSKRLIKMKKLILWIIINPKWSGNNVKLTDYNKKSFYNLFDTNSNSWLNMAKLLHFNGYKIINYLNIHKLLIQYLCIKIIDMLSKKDFLVK